MLAAERQREIVGLLDDDRAVRVTELARRFQVTEETIRRDLERLDSEGRLRRIHGGAVTLDERIHDQAFEVRRGVNLRAKQAIAHAAAQHIRDGDVIALDASTTAVELASQIPDVALTVVTNSQAVVAALLPRTRVRLVCTGGLYDARTRSYVGSLAERALAGFRIGKLFLSARGVDAMRGLSVGEDDQARIKRRMIELAEFSFLLADGAKLGVRSTFFFAELAELDHLITSVPRADSALEALGDCGLTLECAGH